MLGYELVGVEKLGGEILEETLESKILKFNFMRWNQS